jgi:hypothetical protein
MGFHKTGLATSLGIVEQPKQAEKPPESVEKPQPKQAQPVK